MVLLDSPDKRTRLDDAERIRRFAGGEPPPTVRQAAGKDPRQAKAHAKAQRQAKAGARQQQAKSGNKQQRVAQGKRTRGDIRVRQTFTPKQAAGKKKDGDG